MFKLIKSFRFAINGLLYAVRNEINMRIHIVAASYVFFFSFFYDLNAVQYSILFIVMALVMIMEMLNTAIETLVDLNSPNFSELAKIAKDVAAGAVLICAIASVVVGIRLFFKPDVMRGIVLYFKDHPLYIVLLAFSAVISIIFIVNPKEILFQSEKKKRNIGNQ